MCVLVKGQLCSCKKLTAQDLFTQLGKGCEKVVVHQKFYFSIEFGKLTTDIQWATNFPQQFLWWELQESMGGKIWDTGPSA